MIFKKSRTNVSILFINFKLLITKIKNYYYKLKFTYYLNYLIISNFFGKDILYFSKVDFGLNRYFI